MPRSQKRTRTSTGSACSDGDQHAHADVAGTQEPRLHCTTCASGWTTAKALLRHIRDLHSKTAAVVYKVKGLCAVGQCQFCQKFYEFNDGDRLHRHGYCQEQPGPKLCLRFGSQHVSQPRRRARSSRPQNPAPVPAAATTSNSSTGASTTLSPHPKRPAHHAAPGSLSERMPERAWAAYRDTVGSFCPECSLPPLAPRPPAPSFVFQDRSSMVARPHAIAIP